MHTSPLSDWMVSMSWVWLANWQLLGNNAIRRLVTSSLSLQTGGVGVGQGPFRGSQGGFFVALDSTKGLVTKSSTRRNLGSGTYTGGSPPVPPVPPPMPPVPPAVGSPTPSPLAV